MESASGVRKKREAVIGLTPASLATSVRRTLPGLVRFRAMGRSYHRQGRGQRTIDSATKLRLSNRLPKPYKLRTISIRKRPRVCREALTRNERSGHLGYCRAYEGRTL